MLSAEYTVHRSMSLAGTLQWEWVDGDVYECKERSDTWSVGVWRKRKGRRGEKRENEGITLYNILPVCKGNESRVPHWGFIISKISQNNPFQHPPLPPPNFPAASTLSQTSVSAAPEDWQLPQKESFAVRGRGYEGKTAFCSRSGKAVVIIQSSCRFLPLCQITEQVLKTAMLCFSTCAGAIGKICIPYSWGFRLADSCLVWHSKIWTRALHFINAIQNCNDI